MPQHWVRPVRLGERFEILAGGLHVQWLGSVLQVLHLACADDRSGDSRLVQQHSNAMQPRQMGEPFNPLDPSFTYCILRTESAAGCSCSKQASRTIVWRCA